jgi:hypothetical protein
MYCLKIILIVIDNTIAYRKSRHTDTMKKTLIILLTLLTGAIQSYCQCNTALIISQGRPAYASSQESAAYPPENAFDGDRTARWSSAASDPQYIYVDLGVVTSLCQVDLIWEAAYGKDFTIDISDDAATWVTVATITGNSSLNNYIPITGNGRYVRMYGTARGTPNGYSLFGMHVYGTAPSPSCSATNLALGGISTTSSTESIAFPASNAFDGNLSTRWSSMPSDPQFIYTDLGGMFDLCSITLIWETAYATDFHIDVSADAVDWATLTTITGNSLTTNNIAVSGLARYVRMYGTTRATAYGYSLYEFTVHGYAVLPVSLNGFDASVNPQKNILLQWNTRQEFNNDHFDIERSDGNAPFMTIGTVTGKGNTNNPTTYSWVDLHPASGKNIYRLRQVDRDGKYKYSVTTMINLPGNTQSAFSVYPNPVTDQLIVSNSGEKGIVSASLYTSAGVQLINFTNAAAGTIILPMKTLAPGLYILKVATGLQSRSFKILKGH